MKQIFILLWFTAVLMPGMAQGTDREYLREAIRSNVLKDYPKAVESASKAIGLNPKLTDAWYIRGYCRLMLGHYKDAVTDFDKTIGLRPDFADAYYYRGKAKMELKEYMSALKDFNEAKKISPSNATALFFKAAISSMFSKDKR